LITLAELRSARKPSAKYPSQIQDLMRSTYAGKTLLALLDDESPYLLCLAVRCLADLASDENQRADLRSEVVKRGPLVRMLLEGQDAELVEAAARMMINLHGGAPGTPLVTRRRGPWCFIEEDLPSVKSFARPCPACGKERCVINEVVNATQL